MGINPQRLSTPRVITAQCDCLKCIVQCRNLSPYVVRRAALIRAQNHSEIERLFYIIQEIKTCKKEKDITNFLSPYLLIQRTPQPQQQTTRGAGNYHVWNIRNKCLKCSTDLLSGLGFQAFVITLNFEYRKEVVNNDIIYAAFYLKSLYNESNSYCQTYNQVL